MLTVDLSNLKYIGVIHTAQLYLAHGLASDDWLLITCSDTGDHLAHVLYPIANALIDRIEHGAELYWLVPYTEQVDAALVRLIDLCAETRRSAGTIQLIMTGFDA